MNSGTVTPPPVATMRTRPRPVSQQGASPQIRPARKIFNCIVDDKALVAGTKRATRHGIPQFVRNNQIRLFIPLHALDELNRQKNGTTKHAEDVRETLQWLDSATDKFPNAVAVQGPEETYEKWSLVERFAVPRTLFSEDNHDHELDAVESSELSYDTAKTSIAEDKVKTPVSSGATDATRSLSPASLRSPRSSASAVSPLADPAELPAVPQTKSVASLNAAASKVHSSSASVPADLQPLFNYILWRIHQELDPVAALESFIFLCNDGRKAGFAKGFDIKTKRLEQLREAIGREDRDFKNRQALLSRENQSVDIAQHISPEVAHVKKEDRPITPKDAVDAVDEADDEVIFKPPRAPAAMLQKSQPNIMDPNVFERGPQSHQTATKPEQPKTPQSPRFNNVPAQRGSPRGGHALPFAPRGNMRGGRGNMRGSKFSPRGRGNFSGRGGSDDVNDQNGTAVVAPAPNGQIDPASFSRPEAPRQQRKLWVPT
ncbi:hypothetical protein CKM354_000292800 [Cercospora kikuchii]|uniref:PIN domain-containing protein n=1 Tax=Cercospora kikuchii TaxID=84275 RepID=A0A9P3CDU5_9PEZI|nr:uncharacterized protein CKM354_000292800 [Cercospora kikuchii]GIZ39547.1 hypothetical protein CKM354_000292800 [Cercospora kikuchii]